MRFLALGCALLLPAATALRVVHYAAVKHERCAEHGELIHASESSAHETVTRTRGPAVDGETGVHGHDHCDTEATCHREDRGVLAGPGTRVPVASTEAAPSAPSNRRGVVPPQIYRVAPKTSPPV